MDGTQDGDIPPSSVEHDDIISDEDLYDDYLNNEEWHCLVNLILSSFTSILVSYK